MRTLELMAVLSGECGRVTWLAVSQQNTTPLAGRTMLRVENAQRLVLRRTFWKSGLSLFGCCVERPNHRRAE